MNNKLYLGWNEFVSDWLKKDGDENLNPIKSKGLVADEVQNAIQDATGRLHSEKDGKFVEKGGNSGGKTEEKKSTGFKSISEIDYDAVEWKNVEPTEEDFAEIEERSLWSLTEDEKRDGAKNNRKIKIDAEIVRGFLGELVDKHDELFDFSDEAVLRDVGVNSNSTEEEKAKAKKYIKDFIAGRVEWNPNVLKYEDEARRPNTVIKEKQAWLMQQVAPVLGGLALYVYGAGAYGKEREDRKAFDERYGISKFIDANSDVWKKDSKPLYRGLNLTKKDVKELTPGKMMNFLGVSSWSEDRGVSERFLETSFVKKGPQKVLFIDEDKDRKKAMAYPLARVDDKEILQSGSKNFRIKDVKEKDGYTEVYVEAV